jgi:hypothetical protein
MLRANMERVNTRCLAGLCAARHANFFGLFRFRKPFPTVLLICSLFPLFQEMAVIGYACQAYWSVGYWPSYHKPDPRTFGCWFEHNLLTLGFAVSVVLPLVGAVSDRGTKEARSRPCVHHFFCCHFLAHHFHRLFSN